MTQSDDYRVLQSAAGVVQRATRGVLAVTGDDRASFLQGLLTNDIAALEVGRGCYAAYLTPQGRMIADMQVLEIGDALLLDVHTGVAETLARRLEGLVFTEDVQIVDRSHTWIEYGVRGPGSAAVVATALEFVAEGPAEQRLDAGTLAAYAEHQNSRWMIESTPLVVARNDEAGVLGLDLYTACDAGPQLHDRLIAAGAQDVDASTVDVLRVEAGRPLFPVDMDEDTIPLEAGIEDRAISLTKGCYVGQEVIIRVLHRGHGRVARKLVGLTFDEVVATMPAAGDTLHDGDREIGRITSAVWSPTLECRIALGYVQRDFTAAGTVVQASHGDERQSATVTSLPFTTPDSGR